MDWWKECFQKLLDIEYQTKKQEIEGEDVKFFNKEN